MKTKTSYKMILWITILGILLSACSPAIVPTQTIVSPIPIKATFTPTKAPTQTITPPTATLAPTATTQADAELAYMEEHGFAFYETGIEDAPVAAISKEGEALLPLLNDSQDADAIPLKGAIWHGPEGEVVTVFNGEDGLPRELHFGETTILFSNYTENTVNMALISEDGTVETVRDVEIDPEILEKYLADLDSIMAARRTPHLASPLSPSLHQAVTASQVFEMAGLITSLVSCASTLAFPPSAWLMAAACGSLFIKAVKLVTGDDYFVFSGASIVIEAAACASQEPLACIGVMLGAIEIVLDIFERTSEEKEEEYDKIIDELNVENPNPSCKLWFAFAEVSWNGCGGCDTSADLFEARANALANCEANCGQPCWIMREPRCED
ncbi:MAG: hypothetical protein B6I38_04770 [Anaerolineaceae bacterium 4572_5.1]|nr:MAG: hypothetical protein B6I38_04770 [Anaerolineaceae bacterium 4572_5.1]